MEIPCASKKLKVKWEEQQNLHHDRKGVGGTTEPAYDYIAFEAVAFFCTKTNILFVFFFKIVLQNP